MNTCRYSLIIYFNCPLHIYCCWLVSWEWISHSNITSKAKPFMWEVIWSPFRARHINVYRRCVKMMAIINENMFVLCLSLENRYYRVLKSRENVQIIDNNRKPLFFLILKHWYSQVITMCGVWIIQAMNWTPQMILILIHFRLATTRRFRLNQVGSKQVHIFLWKLLFASQLRLWHIFAGKFVHLFSTL